MSTDFRNSLFSRNTFYLAHHLNARTHFWQFLFNNTFFSVEPHWSITVVLFASKGTPPPRAPPGFPSAAPPPPILVPPASSRSVHVNWTHRAHGHLGSLRFTSHPCAPVCHASGFDSIHFPGYSSDLNIVAGCMCNIKRLLSIRINRKSFCKIH